MFFYETKTQSHPIKSTINNLKEKNYFYIILPGLLFTCFQDHYNQIKIPIFWLLKRNKCSFLCHCKSLLLTLSTAWHRHAGSSPWAAKLKAFIVPPLPRMFKLNELYLTLSHWEGPRYGLHPGAEHKAPGWEGRVRRIINDVEWQLAQIYYRILKHEHLKGNI